MVILCIYIVSGRQSNTLELNGIFIFPIKMFHQLVNIHRKNYINVKTSKNCSPPCNVLVFIFTQSVYTNIGVKKGEAVPLQAWSGPGGLQEVKVPRLHDNGTGWW
jgi:hypothetical protein